MVYVYVIVNTGLNPAQLNFSSIFQSKRAQTPEEWHIGPPNSTIQTSFKDTTLAAINKEHPLLNHSIWQVQNANN